MRSRPPSPPPPVGRRKNRKTARSPCSFFRSASSRTEFPVSQRVSMQTTEHAVRSGRYTKILRRGGYTFPFILIALERPLFFFRIGEIWNDGCFNSNTIPFSYFFFFFGNYINKILEIDIVPISRIFFGFLFFEIRRDSTMTVGIKKVWII